jgi:hypothetical protein
MDTGLRRAHQNSSIEEQHDSAPCLDLPPEGIDARVPLVRYLLEGLMCLFLHDLELRAGNKLGNGATEFRARGRVTATGENQRRSGPKKPLKEARSLGATSTSQRTKRSHERR